MKKIVCLLSLFVVSLVSLRSVGATLFQNFAQNPLSSGWNVFGDTNLFQWDSTNQSLRVTWDSSHTNSYFYHSLGTTVTRHDDFQIEFDLKLDDVISGNEPGKTGPLEVALGFLNFANATSTNFGRGIYGGAPNIVEFDYFPPGYYDFGGIFPVAASTTPTFISSSGFGYAPTTFASYEFQLPTNQLIHVAMNYTASNQTLVTLLTTNGALLFQPPDVVLTSTNNSGFSASDDFRVDTFSISSYSSFGDDYDSVLAHGYVDNVVINISAKLNLTGGFSNKIWQVQFPAQSNWLYTLQRSVDFTNWGNISTILSTSETNLFLRDTNYPFPSGFYRVHAQRQ
jgi:hypothetical protein